MKKIIIFCILYLMLAFDSYSQKLTYSPILKKENQNTEFKIIGKNGNDYIVYKNNYRKHYFTFYDESMNVVDDITLESIPQKILNIDFLNLNDGIIIIYQYQKNNIVYCDAIKMIENGNKISEPINLDTTYIGYLSDNKIYGTSFSEDKNLILLYKQNSKNGKINLATKLFDIQFNLMETSRTSSEYNQRKEEYSDCYVDNEGSYLYSVEKRRKNNNYIENLDVVIKKRGVDTSCKITLPLNDKFIDVSYIKIDNLNKSYIVNAFFYNENKGHVKGLYTAKIPTSNFTNFQASFNPFSETLANSISSGNKEFNLDDLVPQQIILKKNGGFVLISESIYTESRTANNIWNRNYYGSYPYSSYDYLPYSPFGYSQFWNNYNRNDVTRYYNNDILITDIDSSSQMNWTSVLHKSQADINRDDFLSYVLLNSGDELRFLYLDKTNQKEIVLGVGVNSMGDLKKYPTLKSNERGYEFMPKLGKQIGYNQLIVPYLHFNNLGFAKIDFNL